MSGSPFDPWTTGGKDAAVDHGTHTPLSAAERRRWLRLSILCTAIGLACLFPDGPSWLHGIGFLFGYTGGVTLGIVGASPRA